MAKVAEGFSKPDQVCPSRFAGDSTTINYDDIVKAPATQVYADMFSGAREGGGRS